MRVVLPSNPQSAIRNLKSNHGVRAALDVDGVNEAYVARLGRHHERVCASARAEEADAAQERAVGDARRDEDDLPAGREVVRVVDLVRVADAHLLQAREPLLGGRDLGLVNAQAFVVEDEACLNLPVQTLHGRGCEHAFGRAADAHQGVYVRAGDRRRYPRGEVAVADEPDARARLTHVLYELPVARAVEDDDGQVFDVAAKPARDGLEVVLDGRVNVNRAARRRPDDDLVHVDVGRVQEPAALGGGEHRVGVVRARAAGVCALGRVNGDFNVGEVFGVRVVVVARADLLADEEHGCLVALALADDDATAHRHDVHLLAHRLYGHVVGVLAVALPHRPRRSDGRGLAYAQEVQGYVDAVQLLSHARKLPKPKRFRRREMNAWALERHANITRARAELIEAKRRKADGRKQ